MGPLPPIYDPTRTVDKLPQPYRLIDKLVAEIVEKALRACAKKDELKKLERAQNIGMRFAPHAILAAAGSATCFTTPGIAGLVVIGTASGEIIAQTARDTTAVGKDHPHESAVTAMDSGNVQSTGAKLVASASQNYLVVHDCQIKTAVLTLLAKTPLPGEPDDLDHVPCKLSFSMNSAHVAVCYSSGALLVYELQLPHGYYTTAQQQQQQQQPQGGSGETRQAGKGTLTLVVHMSVATIRGLLVGSAAIGTSNIEWQLQQRPDKTGKSDRFHKPARGVYMWWQGCNRIALVYLDPSAAVGRLSTSFASELLGGANALAPGSKPSTPLASAKPSTPLKGAASPAPAAAAAAAGAAAAAPLAPGERRVQTTPTKSWMLPHGVMCSCTTQDGTMFAFGMEDGSAVVWDDHFGGHVRILPRMPAAVSALAFVNGLPSRLFCTSANGTVYVADFARPEDSYTAKVKLPHAASQVYFLPSDPFAVCMCPGSSGPGGKPPKLVWYDMTEQKFVAECVGKSKELDFGTSCMYQPPRPKTPLGTPAGAASGTADGDGGASSSGASSAAAVVYPRWNIKESYFIAAGPLQRSTTFRPPNGVLPEEVPDEEWPRDALLLLYKIDALARYLMPEENQSKASKSLLERMLADLKAPKRTLGKHVKYDQPDPDAPKPPPSALRRGSTDQSEDEDDAKSGRKHIQFEDADALFDDNHHEKKQFKKETRSGGYSEGQKKAEELALDLSKIQAPPVASFASERPASPPWHHTNPLARIHPDWEEAPVLARIMDRIGAKGGGRKKRDRRLITVAGEMGTKLAKEPGPKPVLLTK